MAVVRLLAVALLVCACCGCAAFKDDPIMGDKPWQPGTGTVPKGMTTAK